VLAGADAERVRPELDYWHERWRTRLIVAIANHGCTPTVRVSTLDGAPTGEPIEYVAWIDGLRVIVLDSTEPGVAVRRLPQVRRRCRCCLSISCFSVRSLTRSCDRGCGDDDHPSR
jgi:hypothetical protein